MALRVTYRDGPFSGRSHEFGSEHREVRFGRDPSFAQVAFPPNQEGVSRKHCILEAASGGYKLTLCGSNPVLVGGRPAPSGTILGGSFEMQLGDGGPRVAIQVVAPAPPPGNEVRGQLEGAAPARGAHPRPEGNETRITRLGRQLRQSQLMAVGAVGLTLLVGVGAFLLTKSITERATQEKIEFAAKLDAAKLEQKQMQESLQRGMEAELERRETERKKREEEAAKASLAAAQGNANLEGVIERTIPSIYLVGKTGVSGGLVQCGTGWVVGDSVLATNAHVAELFNDRGAGTRFIVRSNSTPPQDFEVERVTIHPGYQDFSRLNDLYTLIDLSGAPLTLISACDVALLHVAAGSKLGTPLKLAAPQALAQLRAGTAIAFVGYPAERMAGGGTDMSHPKPTTQVGGITGVTDNFHGQAAFEDLLLVQVNLPAAGGASGSPVINADGQVVSVFSAGNLVFLGGARVPVAGVNFSQRSDLVAELLDGSADRKNTERVSRWEKTFQQQVRKKADDLRDFCLEQIAKNLRQTEGVQFNGGPRQLLEKAGELQAAGQDQGQQFDMQLPEAGQYVIIAVAERMADLAFDWRQQGEWNQCKAADDGRMYCMHPFKSDGQATFKLRVFARTGFQGTLPFSLHMYRLMP